MPCRAWQIRVAAITAITAISLAATTVRVGAGPHRPDTASLARQVKREMLHAWYDYERYAWGHDEVRPLSRAAHDWYGESLLMTPVDALDTLLIMRLKPEAERARRLIDASLSFDRDIFVKTFEINIRLLGGLLSAYELTHDPRLLELATDLGRRLLPAFNSRTGLPYQYVNLRTGQVRGSVTNPAETGTLVLEFGTLSRLTGDSVFREKAKRALVATFERRSSVGLVGEGIDVESGEWTNGDSHVDGGIDSYYEYQIKCAVLFHDEECAAMWRASRPAIDRYLSDETNGHLWYGHANMESGERSTTVYSALASFFPAALSFAGEIPRARRLQASSFLMWRQYGIEPEEYDYVAKRAIAVAYHLRPEIVESTYYLRTLTGDAEYLSMGQELFRDFVRYCRTADGYASLSSVIDKTKADETPTFVFAETFKYFYLLFAPSALDFNRVVFNTEAHPLMRN